MSAGIFPYSSAGRRMTGAPADGRLRDHLRMSSFAHVDQRLAPLDERLFWFSDDGLTPDQGSSGADRLVVDSWLVEDGLVRGLDLHEQRFRGACTRLLPSIPERALDDFLIAVRSQLPREGRWFPRVEAHAGTRPRLALRLRPAPAYAGPIGLWAPPHPDPRTAPRTKGPDLAVLAALRNQARSAGADDALLYTADGYALETAHSALVWWRGETLCVAAADLPVLPSVTRTLIVALAERLGIAVSRERCRIDELGALRSWTVNALHGIRPLARWIGLDGVESPGTALHAAESAGIESHAVERAASADALAAEWLAMLNDCRTSIGAAPSEHAGEPTR
jgi:branched-subunit amino acid aminotransferase/4-amino-4-deoxychorismate lyase